MKLSRIIAIANEAYPDGMIEQAYKAEQGPPPKEDVGDTLATFIVRELKETYDETTPDKAQLVEAQRVMDKACLELSEVALAFRRKQ